MTKADLLRHLDAIGEHIAADGFGNVGRWAALAAARAIVDRAPDGVVAHVATVAERVAAAEVAARRAASN